MEDKSFPVAAAIKLESEESLWRQLSNGLVSQIRFTGLVERKPGVMVRIKLKITYIVPPEKLMYKSGFIFDPEEKEYSMRECVQTSIEVVMDEVSKRWIMLGEIEGAKSRPVAISYFPNIDRAAYCILADPPTVSKGDDDFEEYPKNVRSPYSA